MVQHFTIKMQEGIVATSYAAGDKFFIDPYKLLPMDRFLPKPKGTPSPGGRGEAKESLHITQSCICKDVACVQQTGSLAHSRHMRCGVDLAALMFYSGYRDPKYHDVPLIEMVADMKHLLDLKPLGLMLRCQISAAGTRLALLV